MRLGRQERRPEKRHGLESATCEEILVIGRTLIKEVSYLGLELLETGASGPETGDQARPRVLLRVVDTCEEIFRNRKDSNKILPWA